MKSALVRTSLRRWTLIAVGATVLGCNSSTRASGDASPDAVDARAGDGAGNGAMDAPVETATEGGAMDAPVETATEGGAIDAPVETATEGGATDVSADVFVGPVVTISSFGCFARSGDGNDYFPDGTPAVIVTNSPWREPCGERWVGINANGYTKPTLPSTETLTRRFIIDSLISDRATFTVSFEADDAAEIVLNGKLIASCTPPAGNAGECQQSCHVVTLSPGDFKPVGQENVLEMKMVNINNTPTPGGNTGYTGISYAICAMGE